jgi:DNA primase large subunit
MPHEVAVATICNHCGRKFYGPPGPVIVGEQPAARFMRFVTVLGEHIQKHHITIAQQMVAMVWEFQGFALMRNFTTEDPAVQKQEDFFRWRLHQKTLRARAQKLEERAQMVADEVCAGIVPSEDPEQIKQVAALRSLIAKRTNVALEELRQILEEPDLYKPLELTQEPKTAGTAPV